MQYIRWLEGILNGNFGYSIVTKTNIFDELATRIPNTIKLVLPSYLTAYVISIVLGLVAGSHKNKWLDKLIDLFPVDRDADFLGSDALYLSVRL